MKLKCLIVDDEPIAQNIIKGYINEIPNLEIFGVCDNAMEALEFLQANEIDILFLDIEMPKITGLSFLKTLKNPPPTILTTAYREFALESYELNVIDYLLKPFSFERFLKAVLKIIEKQKVSLPENTPSVRDRAHEFFKVDRINIKVYYDEILYIEGLSNYVKICCIDKNLVVYDKLVDLEKRLPKNHFARIHKSYIVSLSKIKAYGNDYVDIGNKQLSIGNTYREDFFKMFDQSRKE